MKRRFHRSRVVVAVLVIAAVAVGAASVASAAAKDQKNVYVVHKLVSDQAGVADQVDVNLVNAWGLAAGPTSPWWVADNGTDVATVYHADGSAVPFREAA